MDFRDNIHAVAMQPTLDAGPLQHEANSSRFKLVSAIQSAFEEIPTPLVASAAGIVGIAARLPGEFGIVGKVAAASIGATALGDAALRAFGDQSRDNASAYVKDAFTLSALTAGIILGPKMFSTESSAGKAFTRDLAQQKQVLAGAGFEGGLGRTLRGGDDALNAVTHVCEGAPIMRLTDFTKTNGVKRVIQEAEIAEFEVAKQAEIRESIAAMVKNGHDPEFLMLSKDGKVLIDREAIETAADIAAFKKP
ncbi:MAG: hypothetical protein JST89_13490 [Cyanobacteria bacterium SZAS-4]|nr:hypothetical protein [Cyanobacteria bacterium SZAS-4]